MPTVKLNPKRYGPFEIINVVNPLAYKLKLPSSMKIWPVFHASLLHPYKETTFHRPNFTLPLPELIDNEEEWEVEVIIADRKHYGKDQFLVKWRGYPTSDNTWEPRENIANANAALSEYLQQRGNGKKSNKRGANSR